MVSHPRVPEVGRMRSRLGDWVGMRERHAYSRKHSRLALRHQGLETCDELRLCQRNKLRNHDVKTIRDEQRKKIKSRPQMRSTFYWLPLLGLNQRPHD